jgi:N-acetyl-anhydromuramyl-L-alanine amidase AmpD
MDVEKKLMSSDHFNNEVTKKTQIVLHHTAGSSNPINVIQGWEVTTTKVGAHFVIGGLSSTGDTTYNGKVCQVVDEDKWIWHLGIKTANAPNVPHGYVDKKSIGIEICCWAQLTKQANGTFLNYVNKPISKQYVCDLGFEWRGFQYYHEYTDAQIASLKDLISQLCDTHGIVLEKGRMFTVNDFETDIDANKDRPLAFHLHFRRDKWDMFPSPKLIAMLNEIHA